MAVPAGRRNLKASAPSQELVCPVPPLGFECPGRGPALALEPSVLRQEEAWGLLWGHETCSHPKAVCGA